MNPRVGPFAHPGKANVLSSLQRMKSVSELYTRDMTGSALLLTIQDGQCGDSTIDKKASKTVLR